MSRDRDRRKVSVSLEPAVHARFEAWRTARSLAPATALGQMVDLALASGTPGPRGRAPASEERENHVSGARSLSVGTRPGVDAVALPGDIARELALVRRTGTWKRMLEEGEFEEALERPVEG